MKIFQVCSPEGVDNIREIRQCLACQQETNTPEKLTGVNEASETPFLQNSIACPESSTCHAMDVIRKRVAHGLQAWNLSHGTSNGRGSA